MTQATISVPAMYGDHHVLEVRRILLACPGVEDVGASSAFQVVEVSFDPEQQNEDSLKAKLAEYGYLEPLQGPTETCVAVTEATRKQAYFRHTASYAETKQTVGFEQKVAAASRTLWSCPGIGVLKTMDSES